MYHGHICTFARTAPFLSISEVIEEGVRHGKLFVVLSPEAMRAEDINDLFVDVFSDFYQVTSQGHTFVYGPRGSGKSMMFRYMLPDCQMLRFRNEIEYFSIYIPIKMTHINIFDLESMERHGNILLNEHLLTMFVAERSLQSFVFNFKYIDDHDRKCTNRLAAFYNDDFLSLLNSAGYAGEIPPIKKEDKVCDILKKM